MDDIMLAGELNGILSLDNELNGTIQVPKDGFSPIVTITDIEGGHRITITDEEGDHSYDVMDGYSPTATVTDITGGHQLSITDENGTTTINIMDGYSPTATVTDITGGHRLTITDENGTTTVDIADGVDGQDGEGVPLGGTAGQVLVKSSGTDYDTEWTTLDASDVGALPDDTSIPSTAADVGAIPAPASANDGDVLTYDDGEWVAAPPAASHDLPSGGTSGQVLAKASGTDYDVEWVNQSGGGGTGDYSDLTNKPSINSVTLSGNKTASDLGLAAASDIPTVPEAATATPSDLGTAAVGSSAKYAKEDHVHKMPSASDVGAYALPSGGIPSTDLASGVQTSLGLADTAYQKPSGGIPAADIASGVIPDSTSDLTNDSGFIAASDVPAAAKLWYATCDTAAATAAKEVTIAGFTSADLSVGARLAVNFRYGNTASSPTLSVNSGTAVNIRPNAYGSSYAGTDDSGVWGDMTMLELVYTGEDWVIVEGGQATTSSYGVTKLCDDLNSSSVTRAATAYVVKRLNDNKLEKPLSPSSGQYLKYNGIVWDAATPDYDDLTDKPQINSVTLSGNKSATALGLVAIPLDSANGDLLVYNDGEFLAKTVTDAGAIPLPSSASAGDVLTFDDGEWVAAQPPGGSGDRVWTGTCSTTDTTQAKVASITGFTSADLVDGVMVTIGFTNSQSYNGQPTLNVNSTGAYPILSGGGSAGMNEWTGGEFVTLIFANNYWIIVGHKMFLDNTYTSSSSLTAPTSYALSTAYNNLNYNKIDNPATKSSGQFLQWNGSAWVAASLPVWNGSVT